MFDPNVLDFNESPRPRFLARPAPWVGVARLVGHLALISLGSYGLYHLLRGWLA